MSKSGTDIEAQLMGELRKGSYHAFNTIYSLYARRLYSYCFQFTRSHRDTEELVQDIFVKLWRYRDNLDASRSLQSLLFTIARNECVTAFKSIVKSPVFEDYVKNQDELIASDADPMEYGDFLNALDKAMQQLSPAQRRIVEMSRFRQMSNKEIAAELHLNEKTVRNHLSEGLKRLKDALNSIVLTLLFSILQWLNNISI